MIVGNRVYRFPTQHFDEPVVSENALFNDWQDQARRRMQYIVYILVTIAATTVGAISGIGGGVIIKPIFDLLGHYEATTIGVLSSFSVLTMALVSVARHVTQKTTLPARTAISIASGATAGGILGERLLAVIVASANANASVVIIQNICLGILTIGVFSYMSMRNKPAGLGLTGLFSALLAGLFLGVMSSFLGIGGGPINVAFLIFIFSFDIKTAAICSLITILFAQISKLGFILASSGFSAFDLSMLPAMVIGAVIGGMIGSMLHKCLPEKSIHTVFSGVQLIVLLFCLLNIVRALSAGR